MPHARPRTSRSLRAYSLKRALKKNRRHQSDAAGIRLSTDRMQQFGDRANISLDIEPASWKMPQLPIPRTGSHYGTRQPAESYPSVRKIEQYLQFAAECRSLA